MQNFFDWLENNLYDPDLTQWKQRMGRQGIDPNRMLRPQTGKETILAQFLAAQKQLKDAVAGGNLSEQEKTDIRNLLLALAQQL